MMHNKEKVSVIVPVYKVERYLCRCIDSILAQTYSNLEVILVDDGSPDNCGTICDEYALRDSRVKVIHKDNGGLSSARNAGLDIATGEYIGFVDSDDHIHPQMYELLHYYMEKDGSDIVGISWTPDIRKERFDPEEDGRSRIIVDAQQALERFHQEYFNKIWMCFPIKLFHRSIFQKLRFTEGIIFEDTDLFPFSIRKAHKITIIPFEMYFYTLSEGSIMRSGFTAKNFSSIGTWKRYMQAFHEWNLPGQRDYYAVRYVYETVRMYARVHREFPELKAELKPYIKEYKTLRPWLRKHCELSRMQCLVMELFPSMPVVAQKIMDYLTR